MANQQRSALVFFERHPIVSIVLVIVLFPLAIAAAVVVGARELLRAGHKAAAVAVIILGGSLAIGSAVWYVTAGQHDSEGERPARTTSEHDDVEDVGPRTWLSPDGTGENCAWFPGVAGDYSDPFTFCNYPAP